MDRKLTPSAIDWNWGYLAIVVHNRPGVQSLLQHMILQVGVNTATLFEQLIVGIALILVRNGSGLQAHGRRSADQRTGVKYWQRRIILGALDRKSVV